LVFYSLQRFVWILSVSIEGMEDNSGNITQLTVSGEEEIL
jgi:hypothetical protein